MDKAPPSGSATVQITMVMRYSHLSAEHRVRAVEKLMQATPSVEQSEALKAAR